MAAKGIGVRVSAVRNEGMFSRRYHHQFITCTLHPATRRKLLFNEFHAVVPCIN
jgi:hypothetical protein